jgi:hypothetical protein
LGCMIRPTKSEAPPGANGMIILTGRLGYAPCPSTGVTHKADSVATSAAETIVLGIPSLL